MIRTPTRRALLRLLAGWVALAGLPRGGRADALDRGIGGTGAAPEPPPADRGIGGTGVVGTIRGFGSIIVNGQHIATPADAIVTVDGLLAQAADLKLGHVVKVHAATDDQGLTARTIAVAHEVVGVIRHRGRRRIVVHGQTVAIDDRARWRVGDRVAVSGLRRPDGVIVASLIEPAGESVDRVVGMLRRAADGRLRIGPLTIAAIRDDLAGQRVVVTGIGRRRRFKALSGTSELSEIVGLGADSYSLESYVERQGRNVVISYGTGQASLPGVVGLPDGAVVIAVLNARITGSGTLRVQSLQPAGQARPEPGLRQSQPGSGPAGGPRPPEAGVPRAPSGQGHAPPGNPPAGSPQIGGPPPGPRGGGGPPGPGGRGTP